MIYKIYIKLKGKKRSKKYYESDNYDEFVRFYLENYYKISDILDRNAMNNKKGKTC